MTQLVYDGPEPRIWEAAVTASRAATDEAEALVWGNGVPTGSQFAPPTMTYAQLAALFVGAPTSTYSSINTFNSSKPVTGQYLPLATVINAFYPNGIGPDEETFALGDLLRPNAVVTLSSQGYTISILGSQLAGMTRYSFESGNPVAVEPGFLLTGSGSIRFAVGQVAANEQTAPMFVTLADGGFTINISQAATTPQWKPIRTNYYNSQQELQDALPNFYTARYEVAKGSPVRFNVLQSDYLNGARIYYETSTSIDPPVPSQFSSDFFNKHAPQYVGGGAAYPDSITFDNIGNHSVRVLAYGPGAADSQVYLFHFNVTN